jgi:hypothetical protein
MSFGRNSHSKASGTPSVHARLRPHGRIWHSDGCFCDIPLSQVAEHMDKYGHYGLGLKKSWDIAKGITPVMYVHEQSPPAHRAARAVQLLRQLHERSAADHLKNPAMDVGQLIYLLKPYRGVLKPHGHSPRDVRFYDEREWRYLPRELESIPAIDPEALADPEASRVAREMVDRLPPCHLIHTTSTT